MNASRPLQKVRSVNSSSANFPTLVTSELLLDRDFGDAGTAAGRCLNRTSVEGGGGTVPGWLFFQPYGLGSDNDAFSARIVGINRIGMPLSDGRSQFIRDLIAVLGCTVSTAVGVAGGRVLNTERFADTITITATVGEVTITSDVTRGGTIRLYSPANDTPGYAIIPYLGYEGFEVEWDQTTGTPTMNGLFKFLDEVP